MGPQGVQPGHLRRPLGRNWDSPLLRAPAASRARRALRTAPGESRPSLLMNQEPDGSISAVPAGVSTLPSSLAKAFRLIKRFGSKVTGYFLGQGEILSIVGCHAGNRIYVHRDGLGCVVSVRRHGRITELDYDDDRSIPVAVTDFDGCA